MIKNLIQTGCHFGKYLITKGKYFSTTRYLDFNAQVETENDDIVTMSIVASYCVDDNATGESLVNAPCSTNFQFEIADEVKASELEPLWKKAVKNLRDKCNATNLPPLKDIPYPPNDMVRASVIDFLQRWADAPEKEEE